VAQSPTIQPVGTVVSLVNTILITGTPGVGKTVLSKKLGELLPAHVVNLTEYVAANNLYVSKMGGEMVVDLEKLRESIQTLRSRLSANYLVVDGHLSHLLEGDVVIVLRLNPVILAERLATRGYPEKKIRENVEAEILDVCLVEALKIHGDKVSEVDVSGKDIGRVVQEVLSIILRGERRVPGSVDWTLKYSNMLST